MKSSVFVRFPLTAFILIAMISPTFALASGSGSGKKHFNKGLKFEVAEEWDKASEEFALAVTDSPKNAEYRLHLQRSMFMASQMYIKRGTAAANEKDYEGAYNAFRRAYAFDSTNELARSEMERMVRLQKELQDPDGSKKAALDATLKTSPAAYDPQNTQMPQKLEKLRDVPFPAGVDLQFIIKELAKDLDLNVLYDSEARLEGRKVKIELKNVTSARALDYIFLQENLFFQKVGPRTIMVSTNLRRNNLQKLVLRTFYLANASPKDVAKVVQSAIPAQPGRSQTIILTDDATNSVTIRDTSENIRIIGRLINSLDKDRAEVVMDVAIYEVNKNDLLQFGNQIGTTGDNGTLAKIGGFNFPYLTAGSSGNVTAGLPFPNIASLGGAIGLPVSTISALQSKTNTKLLASTQIHAFNNEDSSARIGQRVPVQSAQFVTGTNTTAAGGVVSNVVNYEQVGLTLKFKPLVFPNQDVQVAMEIESKDVGSGPDPLTPVFTERTIKGTARVQNNKTLLLASVAQNNETNGRSGLPIVGLIPILGRLFTAPRKTNAQVDIVIAVTPRVIRAPAILPEDLTEQDTGTLAVPTNENLEAMILAEEREENLALQRRQAAENQATAKVVNVQLPDRQPEQPAYVRNDALPGTASDATTEKAPLGTTSAATVSTNGTTPVLKPIDSGVKTLQLRETADHPNETTSQPTIDSEPKGISAPSATISLGDIPVMRTGEKARIAVTYDTLASIRAAGFGLRYDPATVAVRSLSYGDDLGIKANTPLLPQRNAGGRTFVNFLCPDAANVTGQGTLAYIEIEALADGRPQIAFDTDMVNMLNADGANVAVTIK